MKIAEALLLRSDLQKKMASLRERVGKYAVVQDGDQPHEDPNQLLKESFGVMKEFETLVCRINQSNAATKLADGRTLTEAIAVRDTLVSQHSLLVHAIAKSQKEPSRYSQSEIKWVATINVQSLQKQTEDLAKKIRELNVGIQETNWKHDLIES